jgi:hypothetical protein
VTDESGRRSPTWTWRENVLVRVIVTDGDRIQRFELFDICDTDRVLARFEEVCAVPRQRRGCRETTGDVRPPAG